MTEIMRNTALYIILALLFSCSTFSNLKAQQSDTFEWLPVGTEWVFNPYHFEARVNYPTAVAYRFVVQKDTALLGRDAKKIVRNSLGGNFYGKYIKLYLAKSQDSVFYSLQGIVDSEPTNSPNRRSPRPWRLYFDTRAQANDVFTGFTSGGGLLPYNELTDDTSGRRYSFEVLRTGDTLINEFRLPFVDVRYNTSQPNAGNAACFCDKSPISDGSYR